MTETTSSIQNYLKAIYALTGDGRSASTNDLAARLGIAPASVTGMVQKMAAASPALVTYKKHQGARLTRAGERAALEVIRHHRLLETYLVQMLGYSWDNVHEEACRLEHVISEEFEMRIAAALGHPTHDPHGDPIPDENFNLPQDASIPLSGLRPGQAATVLRVRSADDRFLRHINELGLLPGTPLEVTGYSEFDHNLTLQVGKKTLVLGLSITSQIFVETN